MDGWSEGGDEQRSIARREERKIGAKKLTPTLHCGGKGGGVTRENKSCLRYSG